MQSHEIAQTPTLFALTTSFGTKVGFTGELETLRLVHDDAEARPAYVINIFAEPSRCLVIDLMGIAKGGIVIHGQTPGALSSVTPFASEPFRGAVDQVALKTPLDNTYLSAHRFAGSVSLDRSVAAEWEAFRTETVSRPPEQAVLLTPVLLGRLSDEQCSRRDEVLIERIVELASSPDRGAQALAAGLLAFADVARLERVTAALSGLPSYELLFPALRRTLSGGQARFAYQLTERLADRIARYGWSVGDHSYGNPNVIEPDLGKLIIGKYCSMNDIVIILGNHRADAASSYPFVALQRFWPTARALRDIDDHVSKDVVIGNDVWIGNGALVLPGTVIGHGAVIGAHAVARGVIPPYAVVVGNPGKVIRFRFNENQVAGLLALGWWDWPDHKVDRFIPLILGDKVDEFLEQAGREDAIAMAAERAVIEGRLSIASGEQLEHPDA